MTYDLDTLRIMLRMMGENLDVDEFDDEDKDNLIRDAMMLSQELIEFALSLIPL